jgi:hypothetical protein
MRQIKSQFRGKHDDFLLCDEPSELVTAFEQFGAEHRSGSSWQGNVGTAESLRRAQSGDFSLVAESDALVAKLEDQIIRTKKWRNIDDVVGSLPNVPAYLAGVPQSMRRRTREDRDDAPITVFVDLTSSAGIGSREVMLRGTTVLAFARLLTEHRAVTLWAGVALGGPSSSTVAWRIDTAPMDLARAAHLLCSTSMSRGVGYALATAFGQNIRGSWPFSNFDLHKHTAQERLQAVFATELCYVPPIYLTDPLVSDPLGWIKRELLRYTGQGGEEDAAQ